MKKKLLQLLLLSYTLKKKVKNICTVSHETFNTLRIKAQDEYILHKFLQTMQHKLSTKVKRLNRDASNFFLFHQFMRYQAFLSKNLEKVWNIEKVWDIAKFRKMKAKNDRVPTFFYGKIFRWTQPLSMFHNLSVRYDKIYSILKDQS